MSLYTGLPDRVRSTLADDDGHGTRVYRLADERGYTHRYETIRVRPFRDYGNPARYRIDRMTAVGWKDLAEGDRPDPEREAIGPDTYAVAVYRAVSILFGMEGHG